ncbi:hypothetical protein N7461_004630 [Penicillium sp. DV-2018c]|nr:hypothetical protein N7461_004630 [Penicillium sp. DV-2018c]
MDGNDSGVGDIVPSPRPAMRQRQIAAKKTQPARVQHESRIVHRTSKPFPSEAFSRGKHFYRELSTSVPLRKVGNPPVRMGKRRPHLPRTTKTWTRRGTHPTLSSSKTPSAHWTCFLRADD